MFPWHLDSSHYWEKLPFLFQVQDKNGNDINTSVADQSCNLEAPDGTITLVISNLRLGHQTANFMLTFTKAKLSFMVFPLIRAKLL